MKFALVILCTLAAGFLGTPAALAGTFSTGTFTGNADSGISSANTYTHTIDLAQDAASTTINGVVFVSGGNGVQSGLHYDLEGAINSSNGQANNLSGSIGSLDSNSFYGNSSPSETLTLTGLNDSLTYVATFYNVGFGSAGGQYTDVTDGQGGSILYDENAAGTGNGSLLKDTYSPVGGSITFTWTIDITHANAGDPNVTTTNNPFLQFGFSNQVLTVPAPEPGSLVLLAVAALGLAGVASRGRSVARRSRPA